MISGHYVGGDFGGSPDARNFGPWKRRGQKYQLPIAQPVVIDHCFYRDMIRGVKLWQSFLIVSRCRAEAVSDDFFDALALQVNVIIYTYIYLSINI